MMGRIPRQSAPAGCRDRCTLARGRLNRCVVWLWPITPTANDGSSANNQDHAGTEHHDGILLPEA